MRIVVNGQQAFGAAVLDALLEGGEDVVAVYRAPDEPGGPPDPLAEAAREADILLRQPDSFETKSAAAELAALRPDLMVMAFVTLFVPEPVLTRRRTGRSSTTPRCCRATAGRARSTGRSSRATRRAASQSSGPTMASTPARY
jgi:hypothetical protein